jgi:membrane-bound inhibitor of C-type lysozyme
LQIEFSDLIASTSQISFNKKKKLGSKSFETHDLSLYSRDVSSKKRRKVCPQCNTINPLESKYCNNCSQALIYLRLDEKYINCCYR